VPRVVGDRHPPVQDIEREAVLAAHERPDLAPEDGNLLGAIQTGHLEGPAAGTHPAAGCSAMIVAAAGVVVAMRMPVVARPRMIGLGRVAGSGALRGTSRGRLISVNDHGRVWRSCPPDRRWD
jgi:hypothetical protein